MNARKADNVIHGWPRGLDSQGLQDYTGLGKEAARQLGKEAGAIIKCGRRVIYDREKIDRYFDSLSA